MESVQQYVGNPIHDMDDEELMSKLVLARDNEENDKFVVYRQEVMYRLRCANPHNWTPPSRLGNALVGPSVDKSNPSSGLLFANDQEDTSDADDGHASEEEHNAVAQPDHDANHRIVRTKTTADRVYLLDVEKKSRQWMTNPAVVESYGFSMADVVEIDDDELLRYEQGQAIFEPRNA